MNSSKISILFSSLLTLVCAESINLQPIDVLENNLTKSTLEISKEEAKETATVTLQDRLARDVSFSIIAGGNVEKTVSFRGVDFKATEYVEDGIPLYRSVNGLTDPKFTLANTALLINDGSGTSTLGVSAIGGEVQIATTTPEKAFESTLDTTISSNDEYYHAYIGTLTDNTYMQADASYYHRSDYTLSDMFDPTPVQDDRTRVNSDKSLKNISLKSGMYIDEDIHIAAKASLTRAQYGIAPNVYMDLDTPVWDAYTRIDRKDLNSFYLYGDYTLNDLQLSIRAYYDEYEDIFKVYDDPEYLSNWPVVTYDDSRLGTILKAIKTHNSHTSTFIFQAEGNEHIRKGGGLDTTQSRANTYKLSYLHHWELNPYWELEGGLSGTQMRAEKTADASALIDPEDKTTCDAQLKMTYKTLQYEIYGGIAKKSRMPAMKEMFTFFPWVISNPDLKPEKSLQYTLGYQHDLTEKTFFNLSLYYYDINDLIIYRDDTYINRESAKNSGTEMRVDSTTLDNHHLRVSYAYAYTRDSEGEALEFIPRHQFKIEDTFTIDANWKAYLGYQYVGSRYTQNSATYTSEEMKLSTYHLLDTQASYKVSDAIHCRTGIKNLLDEAYEWRYGYPSEGRSYYLSLEWKL